MKVQKLIDILKGKEIGGVTKKPREISLYVRNQDGSEKWVMSEDSEIRVTGGSDGILGASLELTIINPFVDPDIHCSMDFTEDEVQILLKGIMALKQMSELTDVSTEDMVALVTRFIPYLED